jgi:hypothetical protein
VDGRSNPQPAEADFDPIVQVSRGIDSGRRERRAVAAGSSGEHADRQFT